MKHFTIYKYILFTVAFITVSFFSNGAKYVKPVFTDISVTFYAGYIGVQGANTNKADSINNLSTLGISSVTFIQNDANSDGVFGNGGIQGNDYAGTIKITLKTGTIITLTGALNWRETTGNKVEVLGFILDNGQSANFKYGKEEKSKTFYLVGGTTKGKSSTIGLRSVNSSFKFTDGESRSGNAATVGLLSALSDELPVPPYCAGTQATKSIKEGAFIIDMGILPQTVGNALKPYGLIYDLLRNFQVPILWSINECKVKDGIDFSIGGNSYKGGPFIIESQYRSDSVNARITAWQALGVVGVTTTSPLTVPYTTTLIKAPNWTLDKQNGQVAIPYFSNAGIPDVAYGGSESSGWKNPSDLGSCDDLFIMPHADPAWATHGSLLDWNLNYKGGIWLGCSAGSHLEDMFNPADFTKQTNFLSEKTGLASGPGPYIQNALILADAHEDGVPPYNYDPTLQYDPIMQFMGTIDQAVTSGAETVYIPLEPGWRASTKVGIYQNSNTEVVDGTPKHRAAIIAWGYAFGDVNRGKVFIEASHQFNPKVEVKKTGGSSISAPVANINNAKEERMLILDDKESSKTITPDQIAAQRIFFNFSFTAAVGKDIVPTISGLPKDAPILFSGQTLPLSVTVPSGSNINSYSIQWSSSSGGTFSPNATSANATFTAPAKTGICQLSVTIKDACGRIYFDSKPVDIQCMMTVSPVAKDICYGASATSGAIDITVTNGAGPFVWAYKKVGATDSVKGTGIPITGLSVGSYGVKVIGSNGVGCISTLTSDIKVLTPFSVSATSVNNICNGANAGSINLTVNGGAPSYSYNWGSGLTTQNLNNLLSGKYNVTVTDSKSCTAKLSDSIIITQPSLITLTPSVTNINCYGQNTGAIALTITGGVSPYTYLWNDGTTIKDKSSLSPATYSLTVNDANGCSKSSGNIIITQPTAALGITEVQTNVACNGVASGALNITVTGGTSPYTYAWTKTGDETFSATTEDLSSLSAGTYAVTVTDNKGCTKTKTYTITQPTAISITNSITNLNYYGSNDGSISLNVSGGTSPYVYAWTKTGDGTYSATTQNIGSLVAATYNVRVTDGNACVTNVTSLTVTQPSVLSIVKTLTPVNCYGEKVGAITIVVSGGTAGYTYLWNDGATTQNRTGIGGGTYSVTITDSKNGSKLFDNIIITQPTSAMSLSETHIAFACALVPGSIDVSLTGGTIPYTYAWTKNGGGFTATTQDINSITAGTYNLVATDANACVANKSVTINTIAAMNITTVNKQPDCPPDISILGNNGAITLSMTGGTASYTYAWTASGTGIIPSGQNSNQSLTSLVAGIYQVIATDAKGCTSTSTQVLNYLTPKPSLPESVKH